MIRVVALLMALFVSIPAYAQNWDEGGTLRDETVIGWAMSTDATNSLRLPTTSRPVPKPESWRR